MVRFLNVVVAPVAFIMVPPLVANDAKHEAIDDSREETVHLRMSELTSVEGVLFFKEKPFNGKARRYFNDVLVEIVPIRDGIVTGVKKLLRGDGGLRGFSSVRNGKMEGPTVRFYPDGTISFFGNYADGKPIGWHYYYHPNGALKRKSHYISGNLSGESMRFYANGNIKILENYRAGKRHGKYCRYDENGRLVEQEVYHNGTSESDAEFRKNERLFREEKPDIFGD